MSPRRTALVVASLLLLAACGIPQDRHPALLPGGVVTPALGTARTTATTPQPAVETTVFFARGEHVVPVIRHTTRPGVDTALQELLAGPTDSELASGLRTAISSQTDLRLVQTDGAAAVIDLTRAFVEVGGQEQILALAQVVLTATAVPGVTSVRFALEGQPVEVPRADGTLSPGPLTVSDYAALREVPRPARGP